jgi:signal transduction histidine kinase
LERDAKAAQIGQRLVNISHDLRNSIGFISTSMEFLTTYLVDVGELLDAYGELEGQLGTKERDLLAKFKAAMRYETSRADATKVLAALQSGSERSLSLINSLLAYAKGEGQEPFEPCDLGRQLDEAVALVQRAQKGRIAFVREVEQVPSIEGRGGHLFQVLENLLVNAVQAIPDRGEVRVELRPEPGGRRVLLAIRDSGGGIAPENLNKVFDPFFTTKPPGKGTGLGLSIVREIIEAHGGEIHISSELGKGTAVKVTLPVVQAARS